jgi:imidazolonepropionase
VLRGATITAARALSLHGEIGSLAPNYRADLAVMDAPSLNHWLYHFRPNACRAVMKSGHWIES